MIERINREIQHEASVEGTFPDDHSASDAGLYLARHFAAIQWGSRKYMSMKTYIFSKKIKIFLTKRIPARTLA